MLIQPKARAMTQEKTSGIKLHIGVDTRGLPHALMITTADFTDRKGAIDMVTYYCDYTDNLSEIKTMLVDGGYTGQNFAKVVRGFSKVYGICLTNRRSVPQSNVWEGHQRYVIHCV